MQSVRNIPAILFMLLWGMGLTAQQSEGIAEMYGQLFTARSGLSQSDVRSILQDSLGFLWVGTPEGLNKYDGYSFQQFRYQPDTISLSNNSIRCLAEGKKGVLWVGTDFGLNKLDRIRAYNWTHYLPGREDSIRSSNQAIYSINIDEDGNVWVRSDRRLTLLDPDAEVLNSFDLFNDESNIADNDESYSMVIGPSGLVWMGTKDGIQLIDPESGALTRYSVSSQNGLTSNNVREVFFDSQGRFWCGTDKGLFLYEKERNRFLEAGKIIPQLFGLNVLSILEDTRGELLIGTNNKMFRVLPDLSRAYTYSGFSRPDVYTQFAEVNVMFEDASRILWIGTSAGLVKIDQKPRKFEIINSTHPDFQGLSSNIVSSIYQDKNGDLWIGTDGAGINYFKEGSQKAIHYNTITRDISCRLPNDQIYAIHRDRSGNLWLGTGNGVSVMRSGSDRFYRFCDADINHSCEIFDRQHVYDVFEDSGGKLWFGASNGIHVYYPEERTIKSIRRIHYGDEILEVQDVYCIIQDFEGRIWLGSSAGLIKYSPGEDKYELFQAGIMNRSSNINSNTVYSLCLDTSGDLWIGTASGLNKYNRKKNSFEFIADPVELSELRIYGILDDGSGTLWMSSERGLASYVTALETFILYGPAEGLQNYEFLPGSYYKNPDGRMYFGGIDGLNTFHPDSIRYNPYLPRLSFSQFVQFRQQGGMTKPLALDRVSTVIVPRGMEIVTIRFSALEFTAPERNRYLYKMVRKGQDGLWIHNGEQNYITFFRLSPGTYTLSVKGSNNDLLYSEEEIEMEIAIPYPFWNKPVAILLYLIICGLIMFAGVRVSTRKLRRSNKILREKEISAIEIKKHREDLALKNKNITDSIHYAKRIQHALLPTVENFENLFPDSFVLFKPKDIVSGDFYWINQHGNKVYIAAVDCTGHGVPGAFVSIIGFELFRKITASDQGSNPAMILDTLNDNFTDIFSDGEQVYLNDGMDLSLCIIDKKERSLDFSGAFNPLYLVRNETIVEVKADRFSVGADVHFSSERKLFKSHKIYLQENDIIYMFSDGYADQFGGPEGKKFKYRRFRHLLLTIHKLPMEKQKSILDSSIEEWMGGGEQIDDILVIGIRP